VHHFRLAPVELFTFEPNGDGVRMLGREEQVGIVRNAMQINPNKMEVLVISSSRGMGKTFFMKKLSRMINGPLTPARRMGRIVSINCTYASELFKDDKYLVLFSIYLCFYFYFYFCFYFFIFFILILILIFVLILYFLF
jgi:hypothetical protein